MSTARFICDSPYINADLYYATKFLSPDPFVFFEHRKKKYMVVDALEFGRAKRQADVDKVFLTSDYKKNIEIRRKNPIDLVDVLGIIFKKMGVRSLEVPQNFPINLAEKFKERKFKLIIGPSPFYSERTQKTPQEKRMILNAQKDTFGFIGIVEKALEESKIKGEHIYYKGKLLTSEMLKEMVLIAALKKRYDMDMGLIIACDKQAVDPHESGSGPIKAHKAIVVDIFPRSQINRYCGDATRTFCKGKAPIELKRMYDTVKQAQTMAIKTIRADINAKIVHEKTISFFDSCGYKTGNINGLSQGFIHPTGHGIGLEVHDLPPIIGPRDCILKKGNITSVEPGLYYKKIGGVRIEDLVYVTKTGCEVLSYYPKQLEIP